VSPRVRSAVIAAVVVLLDRATKIYIRDTLSLIDIVPVIPGFFNIVHVENPGASFGMLADAGEWRKLALVWLALIVMAVVGFMLWRPANNKISTLAQTGLAVIFGGAAGNVWDRIAQGTVTDFLQFFFGSYEFPSFNVADAAINVGAGLIVIDMWKSRGPTPAHEPRP
jgi:signal peptidase II